jgi:hypothetical protein
LTTAVVRRRITCVIGQFPYQIPNNSKFERFEDAVLIATDWFDGTRCELNLPDGWIQVTGRVRPFVLEAERKELYFAVRKAFPASRPDTREEPPIEACRTMALHEALTVRFWPGNFGVRVVQSIAHSIQRIKPLKRAVVRLWMQLTGASVVRVGPGLLDGGVLCTSEQAGERCRGFAQFNEWRLYIDARAPTRTDALATVELLGAMKFSRQTNAAAGSNVEAL